VVHLLAHAQPVIKRDRRSIGRVGLDIDYQGSLPPCDGLQCLDQRRRDAQTAKLPPGQIVADIGLERPPIRNPDGSIILHIEALTVAE
jgi:hypothetical protein